MQDECFHIWNVTFNVKRMKAYEYMYVCDLLYIYIWQHKEMSVNHVFIYIQIYKMESVFSTYDK